MTSVGKFFVYGMILVGVSIYKVVTLVKPTA